MIEIPFNTPSTGAQPHLMDAKPPLSTPSTTPPSHVDPTESDDRTHAKDRPTMPVQTPQPLETPSAPNPACTIQPEWQSTHAHKPSQYVQHLEQGEGTLHGYTHSKPDDKIPSIRGSSAVAKDANSFVNDAVYYIEFNNVTLQDLDGDPGSLSEAKLRTDWPQWEKAINTELKTVEDAGTYEEVLRPPGKNIVNCKLIFKIKRKADGSILKYKACLVAHSFTQIYGVDYYETYSPVARMASFCTIITIATEKDWEINSFDFNSAYLNGKLDPDEEIYMEFPPGYKPQGMNTILRLRKTLCSLKQAS
jgi:Reverse transcriptase (RNA-dependent DNA polymerase)